MQKKQHLEILKKISHEKDNNFASRLGGAATTSNENGKKENDKPDDAWSEIEKTMGRSTKAKGNS